VTKTQKKRQDFTKIKTINRCENLTVFIIRRIIIQFPGYNINDIIASIECILRGVASGVGLHSLETTPRERNDNHNRQLNIASKSNGKVSKSTTPGGRKPRTVFPEGERERAELELKSPSSTDALTKSRND